MGDKVCVIILNNFFYGVCNVANFLRELFIRYRETT